VGRALHPSDFASLLQVLGDGTPLMKARLWLALAILMGTMAGTFPEDVEYLNAQREAVAAFPELGIAGSPLNTKFLELYHRAIDARSPVLAEPDWPMLLALEAAETLAFKLELRPTRFYCPTFAPPEIPVDDESEWQKKNAHRVTLPACIFTPEEGIRALAADTFLSPKLLRAFTRFEKATAAGDVDGFRALLEPETRQAFEMQFPDTPARKAILEQLRYGMAVEALLVVEIERADVILTRTAGGQAAAVVFFRDGDDYLVGDSNTRGWTAEANRLVDDMVAFLSQGKVAEDLLAK